MSILPNYHLYRHLSLRQTLDTRKFCKVVAKTRMCCRDSAVVRGQPRTKISILSLTSVTSWFQMARWWLYASNHMIVWRSYLTLSTSSLMSWTWSKPHQTKPRFRWTLDWVTCYFTFLPNTYSLGFGLSFADVFLLSQWIEILFVIIKESNFNLLSDTFQYTT